tara:strand:+ start:1618 stop:1878 length:261 start_codon:yes stop_codon:yes gene_type:complete
MNKYYITIEKADRPYELWKIELEDHNGNNNCVYEKNIEQAMTYAKNWCKNSEERQKSKEITNNAIMEMIALDKIAGITSEYNDCLD